MVNQRILGNYPFLGGPLVSQLVRPVAQHCGESSRFPKTVFCDFNERITKQQEKLKTILNSINLYICSTAAKKGQFR